jgi:hypothetical protein
MSYSVNEKQLNHIANEVQRIQILRVLDEIEKWISEGKKIEDYITTKRWLFSPQTN